jgi:hypothetical protein
MSFISSLAADIEGIPDDIAALWNDLFGNASAATISADVETDIKLISSGLTGALADITAIAGVDTTTITNAINDIASKATSFIGTIATDVAQPLVTEISGDWTAIKTAVGTLPAGSVVADIFNAVDTLMPYVLSAVGILTGDVGTAAVADFKAAGLDVSEARLILAGSKPAAA